MQHLDQIFDVEGEMGRRMRDHDWAATPLGLPDGWSVALRTTVGIVLRSRYPMVLTWGEDLAAVYNDAYIPTLGAKHPAALGARLADTFAEVWEAVGPLQRSVLEGGPAAWDEDLRLLIERGDGPEETFFTFSNSHVPDPEGPGGVLSVLAVTTAQVVGARRFALLDRATRLQPAASDPADVCRRLVELLADAPDDVAFAGVWLPDEDGSVRCVASTGEPASGQPPLPATVPPEGAPDPYRLRTALDGHGGRVDLPFEHGDGRPRLAMTHPLRGGAGGYVGAFVLAPNPLRPHDEAMAEFHTLLAENLTAGIAAAVARATEQQRLEALARLDAARSAFLSNVSHELRTPLTLLLGPLEDQLRGDTVLGEAEVTAMHGNAMRLLRLVESLLDVARGEADRAVAEPAPTDVAALTRQVADAVAPAMSRGGLGFSVDVAPVPTVLLDPRLWERAVLNLLSNALKYTPSGSVGLRLLQEGEELVLTVRDTGLGIPEDDLERVFSRFERVERGGSRSIEGTGIGLSLVRDAAELHDGSATVTSTPGEGSTFELRLPLRPADGPAEPLLLREAGLHEPEEVPADEVAAAPTAPDDAPHVLVVDDHPQLRARVAAVLAPHARVTTAADGVEALEVARSVPLDAVVSDVMMPRLDGHGLVAALRADPATAALPVVLLTARAGAEAATASLTAGADDHVTKPFAPAELVARVRTAIELAGLRREQAARAARVELLAGVSHDMQTPLAAVIGALGLLAGGPLPAEAHDQLTDMALRRSRQLQRLVHLFLDWSRISVGVPLPVDAEPFDLVAVARAVARDNEECHVHVVHVDDDGPTRALGDALRTEQVLANLVENGLRHGAAPLDLTVDAAAGTVAVSDAGSGIDEELRARLFGAFARPAGAASGSGSGLGLFVAQHAARAQGGELELVDSGPAGTTFLLSVPRTPA